MSAEPVWASERKTQLTPAEAIMVAHAHLIGGVEQHVLAGMFGVNLGRVNEAVTVLRWAAENHRQIHRERSK